MRRLALLLAIVAVATGCGTASEPVALPTDDLPFPLARSVEPSPAPGGTTPVSVYMVRRDSLVAVRRLVPTGEERAAGALRALLDGPTSAEERRGVTSAVPANTTLLGVTIVDRIAQVDLSGEFQETAASDLLVLRVAQVVWTVVRLPGITAVRFEIDGVPVAVVTDRETAVERPVTAPDYARVAPRT